MKPSRPLTHDLFSSFASSFEILIKEIIIYNLVEGVFYAKLVCQHGENEVEIDGRTSDAIAIGLRAGCPVYTYEHILSSAGIQLEEEMVEAEKIEPDQEEVAESSENELEMLSTEELEQLLQEAIDGEDYERASEIRDELSKRSK